MSDLYVKPSNDEALCEFEVRLLSPYNSTNHSHGNRRGNGRSIYSMLGLTGPIVKSSSLVLVRKVGNSESKKHDKCHGRVTDGELISIRIADTKV